MKLPILLAILIFPTLLLAGEPLPGFVRPTSYKRVMRLYDGGRCKHRAVDIGAVDRLGTPVVAITKSKVILIGLGRNNRKKFGRPDHRKGKAKRGGKLWPRRIKVKGYGTVYPFTRNYGRWRSGNVLVTQIVEGPFTGTTIRYMHLADIRHDLRVGQIVEAGEEIGLLGSTAIQESWPHLHIDMENAAGQRIDPAPFIGLRATAQNCPHYVDPLAPLKQNQSPKSTDKTTLSRQPRPFYSTRQRRHLEGLTSPNPPHQPQIRTLQRMEPLP